jgi:hypothetical protein
MKNQRWILSSLRAVAFAGLVGVVAASCGGKSANPKPGNTAGAGGGAGASGSAGAGGTGGAGTAGAGGGAGTAGAAGSTPDGSVGDGPTACDPAAADPLYACGPTGLVVTCIPFKNSTIPANIPRL